MESEKILFTVSEAAKLLRVNRNKVYSLLKQGDLHGLKLGGMKVPAKEIMRFIEENTGKEIHIN